jgi:hypothetical protein
MAAEGSVGATGWLRRELVERSPLLPLGFILNSSALPGQCPACPEPFPELVEGLPKGVCQRVANGVGGRAYALNIHPHSTQV